MLLPGTKGPAHSVAPSEMVLRGCGSPALDINSTCVTCSCMPGTGFWLRLFLSSPGQLLQVLNYVSLCMGPVLTCDTEVGEINLASKDSKVQ